MRMLVVTSAVRVTVTVKDKLRREALIRDVVARYRCIVLNLGRATMSLHACRCNSMFITAR